MNTHVQGLSSASGVRLEQIVGSRGNATCKPLWKCRTGLNCSHKYERRASPCVEAPAGFLCCHRRAPPGPPTRHRLISPRWPMAQPRPSFCPDTGVSFLPPPLPAAAGSAWDPSPHFQGGFLVLCVSRRAPSTTQNPTPCRAGHCRRVARRPFSPGRGPRLHSPVVVHARGHTCREKHTHPGVVSTHDRDTPSSFSSHFADVARIFSSWSLLRLQSGKKNRFSVIQMIQIPKLGYQKYSRCVIKKKKKRHFNRYSPSEI